MISGELKTMVDALRQTFWTGVTSNPLDAIEQITYLMFIHDLDKADSDRERECRMIHQPYTSVFAGDVEINGEKVKKELFRWSVFMHYSPEQMYDIIDLGVFPFLRKLDVGDSSTFAKHMKTARFKIPTPERLAKIISQMNDIFSYLETHREDDLKGDLYEYLLSKINTSGENGQFRTPRHIIDLMVELMQPGPGEFICDPACGTAGFLISASQYVRKHHAKEVLYNEEGLAHFQNRMFTGYDRDDVMLRIGTMNLMEHHIANPQISYADSLTEKNKDESLYSLILTNPPFSGNQDANISESLTRVADTGKTELLFIALFVRMLKIGGRCASVVPDGVVSATNDSAFTAVRKMLVEENRLEAVITLPANVFKPYSGVKTEILIFTKTGCGGTDKVWFYNVKADGFSLNDKRTPVKENDLPDVIARFHNLKGEEKRARTEQSFLVPKEEIVKNGYVLSFKTYEERVYQKVEYPPVAELLGEAERLEKEIAKGLKELKGML